MRRLTARAGVAQRVSDRAVLPLAEGVQKERAPHGFFARATTEELVAYAIRVITQKQITTRSELAKAKPRLYKALIKRGILDLVLSKKRAMRARRNWASMTDAQLIGHASHTVQEGKIKDRHRLSRVDSGLYTVLIKRNLSDKVLPRKRQQRNWKSMKDTELVEHALQIIADNKIKTIKGLEKAARCLCKTLRKRNLLGRVFLKETERIEMWDGKEFRLSLAITGGISWQGMSDDRIVEYALAYCKEKGIANMNGLSSGKRQHTGLAFILRKRKIIENVFPKPLEHKPDLTVLADALREF